MEDVYLTPDEAAKRLKVSPKSIRHWLRTNKLKGARTGRLWRIREDDLKQFLEPQSNAEKKEAERVRAIHELRGVFADSARTVDDFLREKHEENDEQERRREWRNMTYDERIERIKSIQAKCADLNISTEKYLRHKREDLDREEGPQQERRTA